MLRPIYTEPFDLSFTPENSKCKHSFTPRIWVNFKKIFNSQLYIELYQIYQTPYLNIFLFGQIIYEKLIIKIMKKRIETMWHEIIQTRMSCSLL